MPGLTFLPSNAQHIGRRGEQQDAFAFTDPKDAAFVAHGGLLGVVADGMGGLANGSQASRTAVSLFLTAYQAKSPAESIPSALRRSLHAANAGVLALNAQLEGASGTGTTLVAAVVHDTNLHWISVGDSRLYLLHAGQLACATTDHNFLTDLWADVAAQRMDREEALNDPRASHLTCHLGMDSLPHVDASARPFPLMAGDVVAVCSDGIYRSVEETEMVAALRGQSPEDACEAVAKAALSKGLPQQDNLTIIAIRCNGPASTLRGGKTISPRAVRIHKSPWVAAVCLEGILAAGLAGNLIWHVVRGERKTGQTHGRTDASRKEGKKQPRHSDDRQNQTRKP